NTFVSFSTFGSSVFGGTNGVGVYLTKNAGVNWSQSNDGMGNQNVRTLSTYGNYIIAGTGGSGFWRRYILEFAPIRGDANLDSAVNVLDVTSDVNYILGNPPVPFSVLAADVNTDLVVNVLDVVGTVNIILHPGNKMFAHNIEQNDNSGSASLYIQNNNLKLQNTVPVAGIQFKLSGAGAQNVVFTPSSELTNYQVAAGSASENSKTFVVFTMSDTSLNSGIHTLGTFTGLNNGIVMNQVYIADGNGNGVITSNEENENTEIPKEYSLNQNYPNPFNPVTTIGFELPKNGFTNLKVYDVTGRLIKTLINENRQAGYYKVSFDASTLASGVYFYKLTSGSYSATKKMIVLK
ncbi:MAG: T9SS type A sorting domain-containing protein, partial [Ignavibacteriota bacterium]